MIGNDLELLERKAQLEARYNFYAFRRYMRPKMKTGWFVRHSSAELQQFIEDLLAGLCPIGVLCTPPQHGKSLMLIDLMAWAAGKSPELRKIFASFSERLGIRANLSLQRMYDSERYQRVFPETRISSTNSVTKSSQLLRNREILEYADHEGYFRNTTVNGPVTGESMDFGIIDDPIKGRIEAQSEAVREKTWEWLVDDVFSRFSEYAGLLLVMTRWHLDDPAGRLINEEEGVRVFRYPAFAEEDGQYRKAGEPLFPELKSYDFLMRQRNRMTEVSWQSLYQQNPMVKGGDTFPVQRFGVMDKPPHVNDVKRIIRYWDKAGTTDGGAATAGVKMAILHDQRVVVLDVVRGHWAAADRDARIRKTAEMDGKKVEQWAEQEPGSGGKESAESFTRMLGGYKVYVDRVSGDKETRADPWAAQVQAGNAYLVRGDWNSAFVSEHEAFPNGKYKDQVDAAGGAFAKLFEHKPTVGVF